MKKKLTSIFGIFAAVLLPCITMGNTATASAEEAFDFNSTTVQSLCAELTSSDNITADYTLDQYINDVKEGDYEAGTEEEMTAHAELLNQIIPIETFLTSGQYFYSGAEYAFLVWSTDSAQNNVLIVDYDCTIDYETNMVTVEANLLQGVYGVQAYGDGYRATAYYVDSLFYIKAPEIYGVIGNLHASNDFDSDYSKYTDDGMIFRGFQIYYEGVYFEDSNAVEASSSLISICLEHLSKLFADAKTDNLLSFLFDANKMFVALSSGIETSTENVSSSTTKDLENFATRNNQLADPTSDFFTKLAYASVDKELYINDYVKLGILLDGENTPSILNCGLSFQIASRYGDLIFEEPIELSFERVIFDSVTTREYTDTSDIYVFGGQKQVFGFSPKVTANYLFTVENSNCQIKVYQDTYNIDSYAGGTLLTRNTDKTYTLQKDKWYYIEIVNTESELIRTTLTSEVVAPTLVSGANTVNANGFFALDPTLLRYYDLSLSSTTITIYDAALNVVGSGSGSLTYEKATTGAGYVSVSATSGTLTCTIYRKVIYTNLTGSDQTVNFLTATSFELLVPEERTGYNFMGWGLMIDSSEKYVSNEELAEINQSRITLYAQWSTNKYSITYVFPTTTVEGYSVDSSLISKQAFPTTYNIDNGVVLPESIDSVAYSLENWYQDAALTVLAEYPVNTSGNLTVYAKLNIRTYAVTFNANGGDATNCGTQEIAYGTKITLPSSTRSNYIGTWNIWGNESSYYPTSNFGTSYTVLGEASFVAQWLQTCSLNYQNTTFGTQAAWVYFEYSFAHEYYVVSRGLDLSLVTAAFTTETPYEPQFVFLGWYTNSSFTQRATSIAANTLISNIYAKWRYDYTYTYRTEEYTVTDTDLSGQPYDTVYLGLNNTTTYSNLVSLGFKYITIEFNLRLWEVSDSYIDIYFYKSSTISDSYKLYEIKGIDYVNGSAGTAKALYSVTLTFDITKLEGVDRIYIRYNSHGLFSDTWKNDICYMTVMYVVAEEDKDLIDFKLRDEPDYGDVVIIT